MVVTCPLHSCNATISTNHDFIALKTTAQAPSLTKAIIYKIVSGCQGCKALAPRDRQLCSAPLSATPHACES
eukprot:3633838-Amphidinium_carterae.1